MKTYGEEGKGTTGGLRIFAVFALAGRSVSSNQVLLIYPRVASAREQKESKLKRKHMNPDKTLLIRKQKP